MYRYSVDDSITYSSEDLILFKESPFASWMERLTLENPDHGIAPDKGRDSIRATVGRRRKGPTVRDGQKIEPVRWDQIVLQRQAPSANENNQDKGIIGSLGMQGKTVVLVDHPEDEFQRRSETQKAMQQGADLIVNGQLASGPLSDSVDLLMRSGGFSDLGNYLYIPCDTSPKTTVHSAFRLCFIADLLHSLQGQLPPRMLVIRGDSDIVALSTEDHIYYCRAVKQRFMNAQRGFRKHRMPDPAASAHFGRWSACAKDILRRRAISGDNQGGADLAEEEEVQAAPKPVATAPEKHLLTAQEKVVLKQAIASPPVEQELSRHLSYADKLREAEARTGESAVAALACRPLARYDYVDLDRGSPVPMPVVPGFEPGKTAPAPTIGIPPSSRYSLIDRDNIPRLGAGAPGVQLKATQPGLSDSDGTEPGLPGHPVRPFSSVLKTSEGADSG